MSKQKGLRAVSIYRNYEGPNAQDEKVMVLATGDRQVLQKGLIAKPWRWGDVTEWERHTVLEHFGNSFRGLLYDEDPIHRLSSFDSLWAQSVNGWTDEEREIVEERVRTGPGNGVDYVVVDTPRVPAPWPGYDSLTVQGRRTIQLVAEKIAAMTADTGTPPSHVLAYERENLNRPEVLAAVTALTAEEPAEELIEA